MSLDEMIIVGVMVFCAVAPIVILAHFAYRVLYRDDDDRDI